MTADAQHPSKLWLFSFGEFWERLSFFGTLILLVLYTHKELLLPDSVSFSIYGTFISLSFALPLLGGLVADRWLGLRRAMLFGLVLLVAGNFLLGFSHLWSFYLGLATVNVGTGLYKPTCTASVGKLYDVTDPKRERGYSLFYVAMNIGATLGPLIYAGVVEVWGWHAGFWVSALGMFFVAVLFYFYCDEEPLSDTTRSNKRPSDLGIYAMVLLLCGLTSVLFSYASLTKLLFLLFAIVTIVGFLWYSHKQEKVIKQQLYGLGLLFVFSMFFFVASLQVGSSINLFLLRDVHRVLWGWHIPTALFGALDPFFVVACAPIFAWIWNRMAKQQREPKVATKVMIGLILAAIGLLCFVFAGRSILVHSASQLTLLWVVLGYLGLGAGEICLAPSAFNAASRYAPQHLVSSMTGLMYLFVAFGGYLGSVLANMSDQSAMLKHGLTRAFSIQMYMHTFMVITAVILSVALILYFFSRKIQSLLG